MALFAGAKPLSAYFAVGDFEFSIPAYSSAASVSARGGTERERRPFSRGAFFPFLLLNLLQRGGRRKPPAPLHFAARRKLPHALSALFTVVRCFGNFQLVTEQILSPKKCAIISVDKFNKVGDARYENINRLHTPGAKVDQLNPIFKDNDNNLSIPYR